MRRLRRTLTYTQSHTQVFYGPFLGLPEWAGARRNLLLDFMVEGKISEADTPTIWMDPPPSSPIFTPDALPAPTLPIYPGLGQAPNMLACIPSGLVRSVTIQIWGKNKTDTYHLIKMLPVNTALYCLLSVITSLLPLTLPVLILTVYCLRMFPDSGLVALIVRRTSSYGTQVLKTSFHQFIALLLTRVMTVGRRIRAGTMRTV